MAWLYLLIAGLFEIIWSYYLKSSNGFTQLNASCITIAAMVVSFVFLSLAMKTLPLGTAYAVWTGIGIIGSFILGILFLGESTHWLRIISVVLIAAGIACFKLSSLRE